MTDTATDLTPARAPRGEPLLPVSIPRFVLLSICAAVLIYLAARWGINALVLPWGFALLLKVLAVPGALATAAIAVFLMLLLADRLPFGPAPTLIIIITLISGGLLLAIPSRKKPADTVLWTFVSTHFDAYKLSLDGFEQEHKTEVRLSLISGNVLPRKFHAAARAGLPLPQLVEIENSWAGSFFRGPADEIPFVGVEPLLRDPSTKDEHGKTLFDRMVQSRFALYSHRGVIYGIPHDVHPVLLAYRRDKFEQYHDEVLKETGISIPDGIETWDDFIKVGRAVADPKAGRYLIALSDVNIASFEPLLYQQGGDFFDKEGNLIIDEDSTVDLIQWLIPLVQKPPAGSGAEDRRIAYHNQWGPQFYDGVRSGLILSFICPDWRCGNTEHNLEDMKGKLAVMKLPARRLPDGSLSVRTSTWGGTMLGITRQPHLDPSERDRQKQLAWEYARHIYFKPELLKTQMRKTKILPPFKDAWDPEILDAPDPYWSNQAVLRRFAEVADQVPARNGHPYLELAKTKTGEVLAACSNYYARNGEKGFREFIRKTLDEKARYIRTMMKRNPF